jgi:hypothetical protein
MKTRLILLLLLLPLLGTPLWAQDDDEEEDLPPARPVFTDRSDDAPLKTTLTGNVSLDWIYQGGEIRQLETASTGTNSDRFFLGQARMQFDLYFRGAIRGRVDLANREMDAGSRIPLDGDDSPEIHFNQLYIEVPTFIDYPFDLRFGMQEPREPQKNYHFGGAFFFDPANAESPFADNAADNGLIFRDRPDPIGLAVLHETGAIRWDTYLMILDDGDSVSSDEGVYATFIEYHPSKHRMILLNLTWTEGPGTDQSFLTWGLGFEMEGEPGEEIDYYGDLYFQDGDSGPNADLSAWAARVGVRYRFEKVGNPWLALEASLLSGDDNPTSSHDKNFRSYESENGMLIVQDDRVGLDLDTNLESIIAEAGMHFNLWGTMPDHLRASLRLGMFQIHDAPTGVDDAVGTEIDVVIDWSYAESLTLNLHAGWLTGSDWLDDRVGDDSTNAFQFGMNLHF